MCFFRLYPPFTSQNSDLSVMWQIQEGRSFVSLELTATHSLKGQCFSAALAHFEGFFFLFEAPCTVTSKPETGFHAWCTNFGFGKLGSNLPYFSASEWMSDSCSFMSDSLPPNELYSLPGFSVDGILQARILRARILEWQLASRCK